MLKEFVNSLVVTIIIITMIEMILPNGKNKKYVTFISNILLIMVIVYPIISILNKNLDIGSILKEQENIFANSEYTSKMQYAKEQAIEETYRQMLKEDIVKRLEQNEYIVKNISFEIDEKTYEPIQMELEIEHKDGEIEEVIIDVSNQQSPSLSSFEMMKIKEILNTAYQIDKRKIVINKQ